jgi:hypothetical protein
MSTENAQKSAFPIAENMDTQSMELGLTKREYFAAIILQGMAASAFWAENFTDKEEHLSKAMAVAVKASDELLKQLNQQNT